LFINLICESIVFGFMRCVLSPTNCGSIRMSRRCKRFTNYNWAPRSAAVYTARPTFSIFDVCVCLHRETDCTFLLYKLRTMTDHRMILVT